MSDEVGDVSRRDLLRNIGAITLTTLGVNVVSAEAAQHVHQHVKPAKTRDHRLHRVAYCIRLREIDRQRNEIGPFEVLFRNLPRTADNYRVDLKKALGHERSQSAVGPGDENYSFGHG